MSDDETESDSIGPDIDLEKIAEGNDSSVDADHDPDELGIAAGGDGGDDGEQDREDHGHDVSAHDESGHDHDDHGDEPTGRTTAPQSEFTTSQAMVGALVTGIGIAIAYGVPALLA